MKCKKLIFVLYLFMLFFFSNVINLNAAGWGFSKNPNHTTPEIGKYKLMIEDTSSYYVGDTTKKEVYLTFDAGYDNGELSKILTTLKEKQVVGSFFLTGDFVKRFPKLTHQINNDGHVVCNHSYSHKKIQTLSYDELKNDIEKLNDEYYKLTGKQMTKYFRPPAGEFNREALLNVQKLGYKTIFWSIAYCDWDTNKQSSTTKAVESVINNLHPGAIILLHTVSKTNSNSLGIIIDEIRNQGYTFKTVEDL